MSVKSVCLPLQPQRSTDSRGVCQENARPYADASIQGALFSTEHSETRTATALPPRYLDLAVGSKLWHSSVPSLLEDGGVGGVQGRERGRCERARASECSREGVLRALVVACFQAFAVPSALLMLRALLVVLVCSRTVRFLAFFARAVERTPCEVSQRLQALRACLG